MFLYFLGTNESKILLIRKPWEIEERKQRSQRMFSEREPAKHLREFDEDAGRNEPSYNGYKLPEHPMLRPLVNLLDYPCIIKWHVCLPCGNSGLYKQFRQSKRRKENIQGADQVNNQ